MASAERQALLDKANDLGLEFKGNISSKKLQEMIDEAAGPAIAAKYLEGEPEVVQVARAEKQSAKMTHRQFVKKRKDEAMKTRVVTITNKDPRDNEHTTTAHLSFENQHFGVAKIVPLDIAVELEQALIDIAESTRITQHRDEIVNGKRTGNKVPVSVKKYVISYAKD